MWSLEKPQKCGSFALLTLLMLLGASMHSPRAFAAEEQPRADAADFAPGASEEAAPAPAKFFTINAVLAKLDRERGRGPGAIRVASLSSPNTAFDAPLITPPSPSARGPEPFGLFTFRAPEGMLWRKWRGIETDLAKEQAVLDRCKVDAASCPAYAAQFLRLIGAVKSKTGRAQLDEANRAVNTAIRYVSDLSQHGEVDRWSAPLATFATAKGDCEDYAIAKYVALQEAGFPQDRLRLLLVRDRAVRQDHAVLAAQLDDQWLILDNRRSELVEDRDAVNLAPLFSISREGVHLFAAPYAKRPLLDGEGQTNPAAASSESADWSGVEATGGISFQLGTLPLLL